MGLCPVSATVFGFKTDGITCSWRVRDAFRPRSCHRLVARGAYLVFLL